MSTAVSPGPASNTTDSEHRKGVAPLRAGQGHEFFLRRLHSLSGIIPVGAFLFEHVVISNATAINGPTAYAKQVTFLGSLPFVLALELFGIWLPILFHAGYGFYIWYRGQSNLIHYSWMGNWMYTLQRWTGGIAFAYIIWHTYTMRFTGVDLHEHPGASFGKVQLEVLLTPFFLFYVVGLLSSAWHFAYGIWLFCAKWGITTGERARQRFLYVCMALFLLISGVGLASITKFRTTPQQCVDSPCAEGIASPQPDTNVK
jgi:succinate dehydrogenase / fumarate reductase cytochrome b subunit